jgi:carbamate kinase
MQDVSGLNPVFQNFGQQQANQQAAIAQQNQLVNQAGQSQGGGMNPLAMAAMLRKKDPSKPAPITDKSEMMPDAPAYLDPAYMQAGY